MLHFDRKKGVSKWFPTKTEFTRKTSTYFQQIVLCLYIFDNKQEDDCLCQDPDPEAEADEADPYQQAPTLTH